VSIDSKRSGDDNKRSGEHHEFRRYRQVLTSLYLVIAAAGVALLAASVVKELFFRRPAVEPPPTAIAADDPTPSELLECHGLVQDLLIKLGRETCELLALPPSGSRSELPARWEEFSRAWHDEWDVANARCRFSELADTNLGVAYDRLAQVHGDLQTMRHKYQSLVVRFEDEQAAELVRMRLALDRSRAAFEGEAQRTTRSRAPTPTSLGQPPGREPTSPAPPDPARLR
jgi:hypothetical protein